MKTSASVFLGFLAAVAVTFSASCAVKIPEAYEPSSFYKAAVEKDAGGPVSVEAVPAPWVDELRQARAEWEKAASEPSAVSVFHQTPPRLLKALSPAFSDGRQAQKALSGEFSLETLETLALGRNPTVRAADSSLAASLNAYGQLSELMDQLSQYSVFAGDLGAGMAAGFPYPEVVALQGQMAGREAAEAFFEREMARRTALTTARRLYWEIWYNQGALRIADETLRLVSGLPDTLARRYETGEADLKDVTEALVQKQKIEEERLTLKREGEALRASLAALLELPSGAVLGHPGKSGPSSAFPRPESLILLALSRRQEIKKLEAAVARAELSILMMEAESGFGRPFNLSLPSKRIARQGEDAAMNGATGSVAPRLSGPAYAYLQETRARLTALRAELSGAIAETPALVRIAWTRADKAKREAALYGERVETLARLNFSSALKDYETGGLNLSDLTEIALARLEAGTAALSARRDLGLALAELYEAVGTDEFPASKPR